MTEYLRDDVRLDPPVGNGDHALGPATAAVTLVEYGDYECPYCGRMHPVVKELRERLGDRLRFVFRHMPLSDLHPRAEAAAEAAEAAGAQGKFWEMHDRLFTHQQQLSDGDLRGHAEAIGLDVERFDRELREQRHAGRVADDYLSGARSGTPSTPRFFVNGVIHLGSPSLPELEEAISAEVPLEGPRG